MSQNIVKQPIILPITSNLSGINIVIARFVSCVKGLLVSKILLFVFCFSFCPYTSLIIGIIDIIDDFNNSLSETIAFFIALPIISSDLPFNDDLLNDKNSVRINPNSIDEIEFAIRKLYNDSHFREKISKKVKDDSKDFTIENRCKKILNFITNLLH